ncbi:MAG: RluA family pseudouridine synthase [Prevotellaceae bacterium]|jgi:23S rRNA pseudouridine1911/1915/1917 synthase|nr:RluA family pseudouridine synthase [Prevotellaceae bacterium]
MTSEQNIFVPEILYEDNHIIAINKKPSQIVQEDKTGDIPLIELVKGFIKQRDGKPGNVFLGVVHRLDRPVGGVIIFAKTDKALIRLNELFRKGEVRKQYLAIVKQAPPKEHDILVHYLARNEKQNKSYAYNTPAKNTKEAQLEYTVLGKSDSFTILHIRLFTGRHHQIRCQLAAIGSPIKGDLKYGFNRSNEDISISLLAYSISFIHPVKKEPVNITAPLPKTDVWRFFTDIVAQAQTNRTE